MKPCVTAAFSSLSLASPNGCSMSPASFAFLRVSSSCGSIIV